MFPFSFLSEDEYIVPQTLFDINSLYPKLTPNEWAIINMNESVTISTSINKKTNNTLLLTYTPDQGFQKLLRFAYHRHLFVTAIVIILVVLCGLVIFMIIIGIMRLYRTKNYFSRYRSKATAMGDERNLLGKWLMKRRIRDYGESDEKDLVTRKLNLASTSEESELSDNEIFRTTDFRHVVLKN